MKQSRSPNMTIVLSLMLGMLLSTTAVAHHVLGRPAYSLNEDSNTPPSMAVETQLGDYYITYMVFPAFAKPGEPGRLNLYATRIDNGQVFDGSVTFTVRDNPFFTFMTDDSQSGEPLGVQPLDDGVYRQGFEFSQAGDYIIRAEFSQNGEPYQIDFPLQVGTVTPIGPIGITVGLLMTILIGVNLLQKKRIKRHKIQQGSALFMAKVMTKMVANEPQPNANETTAEAIHPSQ